MPRKVNNNSVKLGLIKLWPIKLQKYGNNFSSYTYFFYNYKKIFSFIIRIFNLKILFLNKIEFLHVNHKFLIILHTNNYKKEINNLILNYFSWFCFSEIFNIRFFINKSNILDVIFLYIHYLFYQLDYSVKKILIILTTLLKKKINSEIIVLCKNGPNRLILKGFKIKLNGRLENQKNQMSKSLTIKIGTLTLSKLNSYSDYKNLNLNTKLGVCNFKLWMFYEIKKND